METDDDNGSVEGKSNHGSWDNFDPGHLKQYLNDAWIEARDRDPECDSFDFVLTVTGNNPITGYSVTLKPHG